MRLLPIIALMAPLFLAACGGSPEEKTVVVNPQPGQTVVIPPAGNPHLCSDGTYRC